MTVTNVIMDVEESSYLHLYSRALDMYILSAASHIIDLTRQRLKVCRGRLHKRGALWIIKRQWAEFLRAQESVWRSVYEDMKSAVEEDDRESAMQACIDVQNIYLRNPDRYKMEVFQEALKMIDWQPLYCANCCKYVSNKSKKIIEVPPLDFYHNMIDNPCDGLTGYHIEIMCEP